MGTHSILPGLYVLLLALYGKIVQTQSAVDVNAVVADTKCENTLTDIPIPEQGRIVVCIESNPPNAFTSSMNTTELGRRLGDFVKKVDDLFQEFFKDFVYTKAQKDVTSNTAINVVDLLKTGTDIVLNEPNVLKESIESYSNKIFRQLEILVKKLNSILKQIFPELPIDIIVRTRKSKNMTGVETSGNVSTSWSSKTNDTSSMIFKALKSGVESVNKVLKPYIPKPLLPDVGVPQQALIQSPTAADPFTSNSDKIGQRISSVVNNALKNIANSVGNIAAQTMPRDKNISSKDVVSAEAFQETQKPKTTPFALDPVIDGAQKIAKTIADSAKINTEKLKQIGIKTAEAIGLELDTMLRQAEANRPDLFITGPDMSREMLPPTVDRSTETLPPTVDSVMMEIQRMFNSWMNELIKAMANLKLDAAVEPIIDSTKQ